MTVQRPVVPRRQPSWRPRRFGHFVGPIIDRHEQRGLIERRTDPADGRVVRVYPSAQVAAYVRDRSPALAAGPLHAAIERTTLDERAQIARALRWQRDLLENA